MLLFCCFMFLIFDFSFILPLQVPDPVSWLARDPRIAEIKIKVTEIHQPEEDYSPHGRPEACISVNGWMEHRDSVLTSRILVCLCLKHMDHIFHFNLPHYIFLLDTLSFSRRSLLCSKTRPLFCKRPRRMRRLKRHLKEIVVREEATHRTGLDRNDMRSPVKIYSQQNRLEE